MNKLFLCTLISLSITGCAQFRDYQSPTTDKTVAATQLSDETYQFANAQQPIADWWTAFQDPQLTQLVEKALVHNLDVRIALANLQAARALSRAVGSDRYPTVDANGGYSRNLYSEEAQNATTRAADIYEAGFDANWELDIFGRVSYGIESQLAQEQAIAADLQQMYVSVAAEVARQYFTLRGAQYRLDIAQRNAENQNETYELTEKILNAGGASALDVSRAKTQLSLTRSTIPPLRAQIDSTINSLSVLTGQVPDALRSRLSETKGLPTLPLTVAVGDVQQLLTRRPDIRSAERTLAASVADYNLTVADLFPKVSILGSLGFISTNLSSFGTTALAGSIGPSISWQVFDRDRLNAYVDQADAQTEVALAQYEKTVLSALEELQSSMSDFSNEEQRRAELQEAAASAKQSATMARNRFDSGYDNFLDVLDAERTLLEAEDTLANSEITSGLNLVAIYKALGGGWQVQPLQP